MNLPRLFFLDFDGTLFKTDAFWSDFRNICKERFSIAQDFFNQTYSESKTSVGTYDIDRHLVILGLTVTVVQPILKELLATNKYFFDDVAPFFEARADDAIVILTQGVSWYHHIKIAALPVPPHSYSAITTLTKKNEYISEHTVFTGTDVVFNDTHYKSLTFVDNMAHAFIPDSDTYPLLYQYRIRHSEADDRYATEDTEAHVIEVNSLVEIT